MSATARARTFRFGIFELDEASGELRKQGRRLRLQAQPCQVLLMVLERAGEIVSRDEVRRRLWPEGTYVDFDHSLNTAVNKLRETLSDPASNPRFIETIPRRGYRFLAPVQVLEAGNASPESPASGSAVPSSLAGARMEAAADGPSAASSGPAVSLLNRVLTSPEAVPRPPHAIVRTCFLLIQIMYLCFYAVSLARLGEVERMFSSMVSHGWWATVLVLLTAAVGIPGRLYLMSAVAFRAPGTRNNYQKLFLLLFVLDALWSLAPFLLLPQIGFGLALGATAALLYSPFAQRSLILMGAGDPSEAA
jgi:DNA-binding winged helix-turn-helix (wHTH) protein